MNNREAMQALLDWKAIRNTEWSKGNYCYISGDKLLCQDGKELNFTYSFGCWELYEEPKKEIPRRFYEAIEKIETKDGLIKEHVIWVNRFDFKDLEYTGEKRDL